MYCNAGVVIVNSQIAVLAPGYGYRGSIFTCKTGKLLAPLHTYMQADTFSTVFKFLYPAVFQVIMKSTGVTDVHMYIPAFNFTWFCAWDLKSSFVFVHVPTHSSSYFLFVCR
jgi:hypothetical protein